MCIRDRDRAALAAGQGQHAQLALLHLRHQRRGGGEEHVDLSAQHVGDGGAGALVRHVQELQVAQFLDLSLIHI